MKIIIRQETKEDYSLIREVNDAAFKQDNESRLIDKLRMNLKFLPQLSLVATSMGKLIGHILFFPVHIINGDERHVSLALAPMSVLPELQGKGVGGKLITKGLEEAKKMGFKSVIVLGHPKYYPKFGFAPASQWDIKPPFDVPDEAFMALELVDKGLEGVSGTIEYPKEFAEVE